jgi:hypothetical protein
MIIWKKIKKTKIIKKQVSFNNKKWCSTILERVKNNFNNSNKNNFLESFIASSPLPLMVLTTKNKIIKIADFGSGSQELFFQFKQLEQLNYNNKILIDSIEVKKIVRLLKINFKNTKNIKIFFKEKFDFKKKYDFIHISDSLQYILNYKKFLGKINNSQSNYIILNNIPAGNIKTYLTQQSYYGKKILNYFYSISEILDILNNYKIIYKSLFLNKIRNKYGEYPQNNFEKIDRIKFPKTIILKKT